MSIDQDTSWSVRWWLLMFSCSQCWCELLAMTHPPHHAASGGVQRYNVSTITLAKLFTTLFVKGELKENWSNIPICVWMIALSCCTRETLHYSNKCTMFARAIKRVDAGHRTQTVVTGGDTCKYNFCLPESPEDRLTVSLAFETLIQCYLPLRCILKQIWSIWITKSLVTPGLVCARNEFWKKEILKENFTGYNRGNISKIMLH